MPVEITILAHPRVPAPRPPEPIDPTAATACGLLDALDREWPTDAHLTAYAPHAIATTRADGAAGSVVVRQSRETLRGGIAATMRLAVADVDDRDAHTARPTRPASDTWRADVEPRLSASGLLWYPTRGGARLVGVLSEPVVIATEDDARAWSARYAAWLDALRAEHGVEADASCADWTRLYRLPRVVRAGRATVADVHAPRSPRAWRVTLPELLSRVAPPRERAPAALSSAPAPRGTIAAMLAAAAPHYLPGDRHALGRVLAGYCRHRGMPREDAAALLEGVADATGSDLDAAAARVAWAYREDVTPAGASALRERWPALLDALDRIAPTAPGVLEARELASRVHDALAAIEASRDDDAPAILQSRTDAGCVLIDHGPGLGYRPVALEVLPQRMAELGLIASPEGAATRGKRESARAIVERLGRTYGTTAYAFAARETRYDRAADAVTIGYPYATRDDAREDKAVAAWLDALGGDQAPRLRVWLASCAQRHIDSTAAVLVMLGAPDVGKSLLATCLARTWGEDAPAPAGALVARFNGDLARCPIVLDDEAQLLGSGRLSTRQLRALAQSRSTPVERKGREVVTLRGCTRLVVACNGPSDLRLADVSGPGVLDAVADRLLVVAATVTAEGAERARACLAALRPDPAGHDVDVERIARHLAWLGATVELGAERFAGAGERAAAEAVILGGHATEHAPALADAERWIDATLAGTATDADPWIAVGGELYAAPGVLAARLDPAQPGRGLVAARAALGPLRVDDAVYRPRCVDGRPRLWLLDSGRVARALGTEVGAELSEAIALASRRRLALAE